MGLTTLIILAMCCNTFRLFVAFLTLLEKGRLETPTLVYEKNTRVSKPLFAITIYDY